MRRRADRDGYLFLRNWVYKESILEVRRDIAAVLQDAGRIDAGTDPDEAVTIHPPHQGCLSWEDVYRGWKSDRYQYHWKRFDLTPVEKVPVEVVEEAG